MHDGSTELEVWKTQGWVIQKSSYCLCSLFKHVICNIVSYDEVNPSHYICEAFTPIL